MFKTLTHFFVQLVAGANVVTVAIMLLVGFSDFVNPASHPMLANMGLLFPVFALMNLAFLFFWLLFKVRYAVIPVAGFLLGYVPMRKYMPLNFDDGVPRDAVKVLSYNVWNYGQESADSGLNPIIAYIQEQDADIVCLQEAMPSDASEAAQVDSVLKPMYRYHDKTVHPKSGDCLVVFSKYPILSKELIPYESQGNMTVAYRLKIRGKETVLVNNHLETTGLSLEERRQFKDMLRGGVRPGAAENTSKALAVKLAESTLKRAPQADAVAAYVERLGGKSVILCGDFNDGPISYAHRTIAKHLTDCFVESGLGAGISYHRNGFFVRIDNVMCSSDWKPCACKVDNKIKDSDHYPIICWLKSTRNL